MRSTSPARAALWIAIAMLGLVSFALGGCAEAPALPPTVEAAVAPSGPGPLASEPPPPAEVVAGSRSLAYYLGDTVVDQPWISPDAPPLPVPLLGAISVPEGEGPFPVAVVLHGRHPRCYSDVAQLEEIWPCEFGLEPRYDIGFYALLDSLSARGYLAFAPDLNGAYTTLYRPELDSLEALQPGIDDRIMRIVNAHLDKLVAASAGEPVFGEGLDLTGKVDDSTIVLAGHSTAGVTTNRLARGENAGASPLPVAAQLLISPQRFPSTAGATADVPTAALLAACDGDLITQPGQGYYETARDAGGGRTPVVSVWLEGANHNYYNAELVRANADDGFFSRNPACASIRLTADEQQAFLGAFAADFFDAATGVAEPPSFLVPAAEAPTDLYGRVVMSNLLGPVDDRLVLLPAPPAGPGLAEGGLLAEPCPGGEPCDDRTLQPGNPAGWRLAWTGPDARLRLLPAGPLDASDYAALRLRAVIDPVSAANEAGEPFSFSLALTDAAGESALVPLPRPLPFPPVGTYETDGYRFTPLYAGDFRFPLAAFAGVDLSALASVDLVFDATAPAGVIVPEVEFVR